MNRFFSNNPTVQAERKEAFERVNEKPVDEISLEFFYKPHTITLLAVSLAGLMYFAFTRDESSLQENIWAGMICVVFIFLVISMLAFPNGPFIRPHPAIWRMLFGLSVLYLMFLVFLLFQNYSTIMGIIHWFFPELKDFHIDQEREYGANCSNLTFKRFMENVDVFCTGHFLGWMYKALIIRHMGILWAISVLWEFTEIQFAHLLPNFVECWWDALILDVLICNGLGIWCGLKLCQLLEMREYKWASIKDITGTGGKIKRAVMQFTPESWTHVRWLDPKCTYMRFLAVCQLVIFWQVTELNCFFLKHIFEMPPSHPIVVGRLLFIGLIVSPSVRQYYVYITDTRCKRVGTQCWVYVAIMLSEAILCIKNGRELFEQTKATNIIVWFLVQSAISIFFILGCVMWHKYVEKSPDDLPSSSQPTPKRTPVKTTPTNESASSSKPDGSTLKTD